MFVFSITEEYKASAHVTLGASVTPGVHGTLCADVTVGVHGTLC